MNYIFNLLNHVGVVAKRVCAAAAAETTAAHEGDDNTPLGKKLEGGGGSLNECTDYTFMTNVNIYQLYFFFKYTSWGLGLIVIRL